MGKSQLEGRGRKMGFPIVSSYIEMNQMVNWISTRSPSALLIIASVMIIIP